MNILVINTGSSSIRYELFDMTAQSVITRGKAERIGEAESVLAHSRQLGNGQTENTVDKSRIPDHRQGMLKIAALLTGGAAPTEGKPPGIAAVGHRVVHGGETLSSTRVIDDTVLSVIKKNIPLAPLHNPANITGIEVAQSVFPDVPHVAVFDTAFHQTLPENAFLFALPHHLYKQAKIRKYGFHGISYAYITEAAAARLEKKAEKTSLITIHLGNGCSMAAVKNGRSVDTSMGMTPLSGLVMGTRCGDIDPGILFYLTDHLNMSVGEINTLLNKESGLKGICGTNDMREVIEKAAAGDPLAGKALDLFCYRMKKYIGAYTAALEKVDAVVFTAGIGENSPAVRERACRGLEGLGIVLDDRKNQGHGPGIREISTPESRIKILVIPANEELQIARETLEAVKGGIPYAGKN